MPSSTTTIFLHDDESLFRDGLASLLADQPDLTICGSDDQPTRTLAALAEHQPALLVCDPRSSAYPPHSFLADCREASPGTAILILAGGLTEREGLDLIGSSIDGLVRKEAAPKVILNAIRSVLEGQSFIDKQLMGLFLQRLQGPKRNDSASLLASLSARQREIAALVLLGMSNKQIASRLGLTEGTVKVHLGRIYDKLEIPSRVHLATLVQQHAK